MKRVLLICLIGLTLSISGFSQLRQTLLNDSLFVLVPIQKIKVANTLFLKYSFLNDQVTEYKSITRLYETHIAGLLREKTSYDSLVKVLDKKYEASNKLISIQTTQVNHLNKNLHRYKLGLVGTIATTIVILILK